MKRFASLALGLAMLGGFATAAQAVDYKVSGVWDFGGGYAKNAGNDAFYRSKHGGEPDDPFSFYQRIRTQFDIIASEQLRAVLQFEIGDIMWGHNEDGKTVGQGSGGAIDADGVNIETRRAYLDWMIPTTEVHVRMGIQGFALPTATFGNPVLDADAAGVAASYEFNDNVAATVFWARPFDRSATDSGRNLKDEMDIFGLTVPITTDDFSLTPWIMYANIGGNSGFNQYRMDDDDLDETDLDFKGVQRAFWVGAAFELSVFEPLTLGIDAMYGRLQGHNRPSHPDDNPYRRSPEYNGWMVSALLEYDMDWDYGTPGLLGWYASGDGRNAGRDLKYGRLPIIGNDNEGFVATPFGFPGSNGIVNDGVISNSGVGTWGIGVRLDEISFVEKLSHLVQVTYMRGTNHKDNVRKGYIRDDSGYITRDGGYMGDDIYLTTKDSAIEVDFYSKYELYDNLDMYLETAYIHLNRSSNVWKGEDHKTSAAWKAQLLFQYNF